MTRKIKKLVNSRKFSCELLAQVYSIETRTAKCTVQEYVLRTIWHMSSYSNEFSHCKHKPSNIQIRFDHPFLISLQLRL